MGILDEKKKNQFNPLELWDPNDLFQSTSLSYSQVILGYSHLYAEGKEPHLEVKEACNHCGEDLTQLPGQQLSLLVSRRLIDGLARHLL